MLGVVGGIFVSGWAQISRWRGRKIYREIEIEKYREKIDRPRSSRKAIPAKLRG
jgi:hypothetical protein